MAQAREIGPPRTQEVERPAQFRDHRGPRFDDRVVVLQQQHELARHRVRQPAHARRDPFVGATVGGESEFVGDGAVSRADVGEPDHALADGVEKAVVGVARQRPAQRLVRAPA